MLLARHRLQRELPTGPRRMGRYSSQSPRLERKIKTSGFETGSIAFGQEWGCSKRCSTSGYLVKKIISFQKMQIVSYLRQLYLQKRILFCLTRYALVPAQCFSHPQSCPCAISFLSRMKV